MAVLSNLQPEKVFYYFEKLCSVPHGSGNTKQISDLCVVMTGGGSLVRGFDKLVTARTGIHAMVAENAIQCVAEGTGKSLDSIQDMQDGTMNLSRRKQIN